MHLYMGLKKEKKIEFNGGVGAWGWLVSGGKGRANGGEVHVVLSLALKMCAEQDTEDTDI